MHPAWLCFFVAVAALAPGCRCGGDIPEPPASSAPPRAAVRCPALPGWVTAPDDREQLVAELITQSPSQAEPDPQADPDEPPDPAPPARRGLRVYADGRVLVFDESAAGKWRLAGRVPSARASEVGGLASSVDREQIIDFQGKDRKGHAPPSFVTARVGKAPEGLLTSCYRGEQGSEAQQKLEELLRSLVNEAGGDQPKAPGGWSPE